MSDWRIRDQELYLNHVTLYRIKFPDFWILSYNSQNDFYKLISNDAYSFVEQYKRGEDKLVGLSIGEFWHSHCDFCMKEINTNKENICYCSNDYDTWICEECFNDFCHKFNWKVVEKL